MRIVKENMLHAAARRSVSGRAEPCDIGTDPPGMPMFAGAVQPEVSHARIEEDRVCP